MMVYNFYGAKVDYDTAVNLMDDEIREKLHAEIAPCSKQHFFSMYELKHSQKYGELWELSKENPVY